MSTRAARTEADAPQADPGRQEESAPPVRAGRWWAPRNWRVRTRLVALIVIPTAAALVLGGLRVGENVGEAVTHDNIQKMATLGKDVVSLTSELGKERRAVAAYIADDRNPEDRSDSLARDLEERIKATNRAETQVTERLAELGDVGGTVARDRRDRMVSSLNGLDGVRDEVQTSTITVLPAATKYRQVINALNEFNQGIAEGTDDTELRESVRAMTSLNKAREHLSYESALMLHSLMRGEMSGGVQEAVQNTRSRYDNEMQNFAASATPAQRQMYESTFTGLEISQMITTRQRVLMRADNGSKLTGGTRSDSPGGYQEVSDESLALAQQGDEKMSDLVIAQAGELRQGALYRTFLDSGLVLGVIIAVFLVTSLVIRSLLRPLRRLREGALRVADRDLPDSISRMKDTTTTPDRVEVEPIVVGTRDEIDEVAHSFDEVHRVAMRLASEEAALRSNVNAMFVNLSRRSQTLVERQLRLIDGLEQSEQDSERLGDLFQLDHLATRMRRNAENLLVLSGQDNTRKWAQPVPLVDVLRGAVSEVEQYDRVNVRAPSDVSVLGRPVNDVIHLVAELVENATSFSSQDTQVSVTAQVLDDGGARVEVTDSGIGMAADEIDATNLRLAEPPVIDVAVSRRMGLFVVSRLAARHGIRVRLGQAQGGGITAYADLPADLLITPVDPSAPALPSPPAVPDTYAEATAAFAATPAAAEPDGAWGPGGEDPLPKRRPGGNTAGEPGAPAPQAEAPAEHPPSGEDLWSAGWNRNRGSAAPPTPPAPSAFETPSVPPASEAPSAPAGPTEPEPPASSGGQSRSAGSLFDPTGTGPLPPTPPPAEGPAPEPRPRPEPVAEASQGPGVPEGNGHTGNGYASGGRTSGGYTNGDHADGASGGEEHSWWQERPAEVAEPWRSTEHSGVADPEAREGYGSTAYLSRRYGRGQAPGQNTVVPPSPESGSEALPIFDAIESNWFKRRTSGPETGPLPTPAAGAAQPAAEPQPPASPPAGAAGRAPQAAAEAPPAAGAAPASGPERSAQAEDGWRSDADRGWQAARSAAEPIAGGLTDSGLPKRVPKANLVPGTAPQPENVRQMPNRSADRVRNRFSGLQKGVQDGRSRTGEFHRGEGPGTGDPSQGER
ncbi:sensor histidine kinase [Nocardiopsis suaedae]|uniref:histidine kinase n=1 Tax=Nocardiopsis suaedae TaxID=3018444 RepID=A0ABT4TUA2_9ACTN|nr:nitrate- and nitrite sensing domain-containing protein [Nocardiopsis suaedae]MDA2808260.1 nitrate- and nitrite sensing domain-containing protein [Nocardiopsis suaedae]